MAKLACRSSKAVVSFSFFAKRSSAHIEEFERKEAEEKALRELYQGFSEEKPSVSIETRFDGKEAPQGKPLSSYSTTQSDDTTEDSVEGDTTP